MHMDQKMKDLLSEASLYGLMAKRYEYVDPQKHMHFYQKHFQAAMKLEQYYMAMQGSHQSHHMMPREFPMY